MRFFPSLLLLLLGLAAPLRAQVPDPGMAAQQDPGMAQDAEAAREKLLKAANQLDLIESNSEANKAAIDAMKADIAQLKAANDDLKQQLAALQAALDKDQADRVKERQALLDEVATLVAKAGAPAPAPHHHESADDDGTAPASSTEVHHETAAGGDAGSPAHHHHAADDSTAADTPAPKPHHTQKGYYHVVESGETLAMICSAYRDQGVRVTLSEIRRANGLTAHSTLKVGEKIFIPKPTD